MALFFFDVLKILFKQYEPKPVPEFVLLE